MSEDKTNKWQTISDSASADIQAEEVAPKQEKGTLEENGSTTSIEENTGLSHPDYEQLQQQLTAAEAKAHENWEKAVRATAELENVRRRASKDVENAHKFGVVKLMEDLLPVVDSLEQALQTNIDTEETGLNSMKEGIELTLKLFVGVLEKFNVKQINPVGEAFNPNLHEAMSMQEAPDALPGTVLVVFQKGYLLNERVIRPARVIVAKGQVTSVDEKI